MCRRVHSLAPENSDLAKLSRFPEVVHELACSSETLRHFFSGRILNRLVVVARSLTHWALGVKNSGSHVWPA